MTRDLLFIEGMLALGLFLMIVAVWKDVGPRMVHESGVQIESVIGHQGSGD